MASGDLFVELQIITIWCQLGAARDAVNPKGCGQRPVSPITTDNEYNNRKRTSVIITPDYKTAKW